MNNEFAPSAETTQWVDRLTSDDFEENKSERKTAVKVDLDTEPGQRPMPAETPDQFKDFIAEQRSKFGHLIRNKEQFELFAMLPIDDVAKYGLIAKLQGEQDRLSNEPVEMLFHRGVDDGGKRART